MRSAIFEAKIHILIEMVASVYFEISKQIDRKVKLVSEWLLTLIAAHLNDVGHLMWYVSIHRMANQVLQINWTFFLSAPFQAILN